MINGKTFAMFFNASPRKGWNTYKMLEAAKAGAEEAGAETELVNLYDIKFPGCKSCFACKLKNAKTNGVCAIRDELRPILERLAFPVYSYHYENGQPLVCRDKVIETANIFTMNCPEDMMKNWNYPTFLQANTDTLATVFGASETLYACNTYQFTDYSRYDITLFSEEEKRAHRDAHFATDLANARALGRRLVEKAQRA